MTSVAWGVLGAVGAALLYGLSTVWQSIGARNARPFLYAAGLGLDATGYVASLAALHSLPLFVVEAVIASSVAVTAVLAVVMLHARLSWVEVAALGAVGLGLVALALSAEPGEGTPLSKVGERWMLGAVVPVALAGAVAWVAGRRGGSNGSTAQGGRGDARYRDGLGLAVVAGLGFAGTGVAGREFAFATPLWRTLGDPVLWAMAGFGLISLAAFGVALQRAPVTSVAAVTFVVETVVPAAVGLAWLGDRVRPGLWAVVIAGLVVTLAGCVVLARFGSLEEEPAQE